MFEQTVDIERIEQIVNLFGNFDENIKRIEKRYGVTITSHGSEIKIKGEVEEVISARKTVEGLITIHPCSGSWIRKSTKNSAAPFMTGYT